MNCFICNQPLNPKDFNHYKKCTREHGLQLTKGETLVKRISFQLGFDVTVEWLTSLYVDQQYSLPDFLREFGLAYTTTSLLLKYFNIAQRNSQSAALTKKTRGKYQRTCTEKYGVDNVSKVSEIKDKKIATFLSTYGADNVFATEDFKSLAARSYGRVIWQRLPAQPSWEYD